VAVAAAHGAHVLQSVAWAEALGLVRPILVGDPGQIGLAAEAVGLTLGSCSIVPASDEAGAARAAVGVVQSGRAQALMKGHLHTDVLMRAVLDPRGGLRDRRRLSHVFAMLRTGETAPLLITDAALNVAPDDETRRCIVRHAIIVARALGLTTPRIALLSATEEINPAMPSSVAAADFAVSFQAEASDCGAHIAGPLALDLALSPTAARIKGLSDDPVAGRASILVVPNIETGNVLFKAMVHMLNATAAGVVLGAKVPIVLTSRSDPPEARLASIALACLVADKPMEDRRR
jgi:phosphate acetyltransferase